MAVCCNPCFECRLNDWDVFLCIFKVANRHHPLTSNLALGHSGLSKEAQISVFPVHLLQLLWGNAEEYWKTLSLQSLSSMSWVCPGPYIWLDMFKTPPQGNQMPKPPWMILLNMKEFPVPLEWWSFSSCLYGRIQPPITWQFHIIILEFLSFYYETSFFSFFSFFFFNNVAVAPEIVLWHYLWIENNFDDWVEHMRVASSNKCVSAAGFGAAWKQLWDWASSVKYSSINRHSTINFYLSVLMYPIIA